MPRGGYRKPANPAPVSTPQSGRRTDGGAGQPIRVASQQAYGERKKLEAAQASAPMAAGGLALPDGSPAAPSGPTTPGQMLASQEMLTPDQMFGPSQRPNEPLAPSGMAPEEQALLPADLIIRKLYSIRPSPYLARLLES